MTSQRIIGNNMTDLQVRQIIALEESKIEGTIGSDYTFLLPHGESIERTYSDIKDKMIRQSYGVEVKNYNGDTIQLVKI